MDTEQIVLVVGTGTELGRETAKQLNSRGHKVWSVVEGDPNESTSKSFTISLSDSDALARVIHKVNPDIVINLGTQRGNTLLHDGHDWPDAAKSAVRTEALIKAINSLSKPPFLIHASYSFLYGNGPTADEASPLRPIVNNAVMQAGAHAEQIVTKSSQIPFTILRLGYLYGPQSRDLKLYELSFKLRRPYYAGPKTHRAHYVHFEDAIRAIYLTAEQQPNGRIINIVDGHTASFGAFIDHYAKQLGRRKPSRIPTAFVQFLPWLITPQQVQMLTLTADPLTPTKAAKLLGWTPEYSTYQEGLAQSVQNFNR